MMKRILGTALGLLLFAGAAWAQEVKKNVYVGDGATGGKIYDNGFLACDVPTNNCKLGNGSDDWNTRPPLGGAGGGGPGSDTTAIHRDTADEFSSIVEKGTPAGGDWLLIEDSAAANGKKKVRVGNLPTGGGGEANDGTNIGTGADVFAGKSGVNLQFRGISTTGNGVVAAVSGNDVDLDLDMSLYGHPITTLSGTTSVTPTIADCQSIEVTITGGAGNFTLNPPTGSAPTGQYYCTYVVINNSGATRDIVFSGFSTDPTRRTTFALPDGDASQPLVVHTSNAGTNWNYDGGELDFSTLPPNSTPASDDLVLCEDVSESSNPWKSCRIDAVARVENDPAPVLAGDLLVQEPRKINLNVIDVSGEIEGDIGVNGNGTLVVNGDTLDLTADALAIRANGAIYLQGAGAFDNAELRVGTAVTLNGETVYPLQFVSPPAAAHQQTETNAGPTAAITNLGVGTPITAIPSFNSDFDYQVGTYLEFRATINRSNTRDGTIWLRFLRNGSPVGTDTPFDVSGSNLTMPMTLTVTIAEANLPANGDPLEVQVWGDTGNHSQFSVTLSAMTFLLQQPGAGGGGPLSDSDVLGNHSDHTTDVTVTALDHGKTIVCDNATSMNVNVDDGATDWDPDRRVYVLNIGAGDCTIQDGTTVDVTIRFATGFSATVPQWGGATIIGKDVDEVVVTGGAAQ